MMNSSVSSRFSCKQCTDSHPISRPAPKAHARSRSYTRSLTSSQVTETEGPVEMTKIALTQAVLLSSTVSSETP